MKAIRYERYGGPDVLHLEEVDRPDPADDEVLVRVAAASVNPFDYHFMRGTPYPLRAIAGWRRPKPGRRTLGIDFAGTVEAVSSTVTRFRPGDEVFGLSPGAFGEFVRASEEHVAGRPPGVPAEHAAVAPVAGLTALQGLRDHGRLQAGERVLVNGASGGVGTFAVQIARSLGAEVTGVCSTRNLELVESIGAEHVIDYTEEDFTTQNQQYDLVFDAVGNRSLGELKRAIAPDGRLVAAAGSIPRGLWLKLAGRGRMMSFTAQRDADDLAILAEMMADGEVRPVIDRRYPLAEVPEGIRYLEEGHARGKVVISV